MKKSASDELIKNEYSFPLKVYSDKNACGSVKILKSKLDIDIISTIAEWWE